MPVAGLLATAVVGPAVLPRMTPEILLIGIGLAILLPVVPFALELLALRRLTTAAFGTLMALEPAFAMIVGLVVLHQVPRPGGHRRHLLRGGRRHRCSTHRRPLVAGARRGAAETLCAHMASGIFDSPIAGIVNKLFVGSHRRALGGVVCAARA